MGTRAQCRLDLPSALALAAAPVVALATAGFGSGDEVAAAAGPGYGEVEGRNMGFEGGAWILLYFDGWSSVFREFALLGGRLFCLAVFRLHDIG